MSLRTLIEINHDFADHQRHGDGFAQVLHRYLCSANREMAEALERYGIRVLGMRHHSGNFILDGTPDGFPVKHMPRTPPAESSAAVAASERSAEGCARNETRDDPLPPLSEYREMLEETVEALRDAERRFLGIGMPASAGYARSAISKAEAFLSLNRGEKDGLQTINDPQCGVASQAKLTGQGGEP